MVTPLEGAHAVSRFWLQGDITFRVEALCQGAWLAVTKLPSQGAHYYKSAYKGKGLFNSLFAHHCNL